jgi:hypothetical protein
MLKVKAANAQSVHTTQCAISGIWLVFVMVKIVVRAAARAARKSTSKYGKSNVAAGVTLMSHASSLFVVAGADTASGAPNVKLADGATGIPP